MIRLGVFAFLLAFARPAMATYLETDFFYYTDNFASATTTSANRLFFEVTLGFSTAKGRFIYGWDYVSNSATDSGTAATSYTSTQMGPKFIWFMNKNRTYSLGFAYLLSSTANYSAGGGAAAETWTGTVMKADLGYNFWVSDSWTAGFHLNYSQASFNRQLISGTYTENSYSRTFIYPTINLAVDF